MLSLTSPVKTPYHGIAAAPKVAALSAATFALFLTDDPLIMSGALALTVGLYAAGGPAFLTEGVRLLRPLIFFIAVVLVWHAVTRDLLQGMVISLRMVVAVALANLVTMTTRFSDLTDVVTWLMRPLRIVGLSPETLGFAISLVIRFTPVLMEKAGHLQEAWRARSPKRPKWNIVLPLTILALDDAEHVAEALRARGGLGNGKEHNNGT